MKTLDLELTKQYAVVEFSKAILENYDHSIVFESDNVDECEDYECEENTVSGATIIEKREDGIYDYYSGEKLQIFTWKN